MSISIAEIAALERANYEANWAVAQITPGLEVILRADVVYTSSELFPSADTNHACLLQATAETVDNLIIEIIDYFTTRALHPTIFLSPACTPPDLPHRLTRLGFEINDHETWMTVDNLQKRALPPLSPRVLVRQISGAEVMTFAQTFVAGFELPPEFAGALAGLIAPAVGLPGVYHYLAYSDGEPVGTYSLICHKHYGILGSAGVAPAYRRKKVVTNLTITAAQTAKQQGIDTLLLQTTAGFLLERLLAIYGFSKAFTRTAYVLP